MDTQNNASGTGAIIGTLIILVIILVGGVYFWNQSLAQKRALLAVPERDPVADTLATQSTSDAVEAIEADLNATALESIDDEFENIDAVLDAEFQELSAASSS